MLRAFVNCAMVLKKRLNFFYFQWSKVDQVRNEYLPSYLNWWHNWQLKNRRCSHTLKGSHSMGDGRIFIKTHRDTLIKIYRMSLIFTGSISLDSTFNCLMRSKAHTAPTAPLVLHRTRIEKYPTKKFIINGQWRNKLFLLSSIVFRL